MAGQSNAAPVIIKRKKIVQASGHHGGAWKVAYADFVTAMMAFFLLMWLLGATSEKQRKGVADYFSPTIPINRISGGGDGAFSGDSIFADDTLARNGTGAAMQRATTGDSASGQDEAAEGEQAKALQKSVEAALSAFGGESMTMEQALRHVVTKVTDEGLVIEIFDLEDAPLFVGDTAVPEPVTDAIAGVLAEVLGLATNSVAVNGHVRAYPITLIDNPVWDLSSERADAIRTLIEKSGLPDSRFQRFSGFADRKPVTADPFASRNNRIEIVLLRRDR
jgi:chemotaxis protein MotB